MSPGEALRELERLARRMGIDVRFDAFDDDTKGHGGLCTVRGKPQIVVNEAAPVLDQVAVLETALSRLDLDEVFAPPLLRARVERRRAERLALRPALRKAAPREK